MHHPRKSFLIELLAVLILLTVLPCYVFSSTVAMVGGSATVDGRPLLIKNRDNSANANQEYYFNDVGPYSYIAVTYAGVIDQAWFGVNELGFAINNADAWNLTSSIPGPDDDGDIMDLALRICQTVEDFQAIIDSTDISGRTLPTTYGVIDATGAGAFFEVDDHNHWRFDLDDPAAAPNGYMVRANFAYEGGSYHLGQHRHDRVTALLDSGYAAGIITHDYVSMIIQQDIVNEETDPYPLPFDGRERPLPYGLLHTHDAINRDITRSGGVIQGIIPGEDPLLSTLWAIVGEPTATISLPLWAKAGSTPVEFDGPEFSALNLKAQEFRDYLYQRNWAEDAIDTWRMIDDRGEGLLPFLNSLEARYADTGDSALAVWRTQGMPSASEIASFQNGIAADALAEMDAWGPPLQPEITITWINQDQVQIDWSPVTLDVFNRPITVASYCIYGSDQPFINRMIGDSLTTTTAPPVIILTTEEHQFFQVRCQP